MCSGLGRAERMRVPWPAARTMACRGRMLMATVVAPAASNRASLGQQPVQPVTAPVDPGGARLVVDAVGDGVERLQQVDEPAAAFPRAVVGVHAVVGGPERARGA